MSHEKKDGIKLPEAVSNSAAGTGGRVMARPAPMSAAHPAEISRDAPRA